jgi:hypothetical protein
MRACNTTRGRNVADGYNHMDQSFDQPGGGYAQDNYGMGVILTPG